MTLLGIDISNNNPGVDMVAARNQGVDFCIAKASQGWAGGPGGWMDWTWVDIVTRARKVGIIPGGYHWGLKGNGAAQARLFVQSLARAGGPHGFLCALDVERNDWNQTLNIDPQTVDAFLAEWDRLTNRQPLLLYGASWYHDGYMRAGARWPGRPLWWARYNTAAGPIQNLAATVTPGWMNPFGGWTSYTIRQFTSSAVAGGVQVDANVCYLTRDQLESFTQPGGHATTGDLMAQSQFDQLMTTMHQLLAAVEGGPDKQVNPLGLFGLKDIATELDAIKSEQAAIRREIAAVKCGCGK